MKTQKTIFNVIALISAFAVVAPAMAMGGVEDQAELLATLNRANTVKVVQQGVAPVVSATTETVAPAVTGIASKAVSIVAKPGYGVRLLALAKNTGTAIGEYTKSHGGSVAYNTVLENPKTSAGVALATLAGVGLAYRYRSAVGRAASYANPFSWFGKKSTSAVAPVTEEAPVAKSETSVIGVESTSGLRSGVLRRALSYVNPFSWFGKKSTSAVAPVTESVAPVTEEAPVTKAVNAEVTIGNTQGNTQPKQGTIEFNKMNRRNKKK